MTSRARWLEEKIMPRRRGDNNFSEHDTTTRVPMEANPPPSRFYYVLVMDGIITPMNGLINGIIGATKLVTL